MSEARKRAFDNGRTSIKPTFTKYDELGTPKGFLAPHDGLTKREHFAALAMQGLLSGEAFRHYPAESGRRLLADEAVRQADELLLALEPSR